MVKQLKPSISKGLQMMKTQGMTSFSARRLGAVAVVAFAVAVSTLPSAFAAGEVLGKACKLEGVSTGTSSTSLVCKAGTNGKLTWQKVRLSSSLGAPIKDRFNLCTCICKKPRFFRVFNSIEYTSNFGRDYKFLS